MRTRQLVAAIEVVFVEADEVLVTVAFIIRL